MLTAYYTYCNERLPDNQFEQLLCSLPQFVQTYVRKYRLVEDQYRSLYGRLLLREALRANQRTSLSLELLSSDAYKRPYLPSDHAIDFNISHSGDLVICLLATNSNRVGVDVEKINPIELNDYSSIWLPEEYAYIESGSTGNRLSRFYQLWTQKEAVMKADGRGMGLSFQGIRIDQTTQTAFVENDCWHLRSLPLGVPYQAYIASRQDIPAPDLQYVATRRFFENL